MSENFVLIIDKRLELSTKYKKIVESLGAKVTVHDNLAASAQDIVSFEPDMIILSDSIDADILDTIKKIRLLNYSTRPIIVAMSKSSELDDRLNILDVGADDFLSEPIDSEEFKARIRAHLRRHFENNINDKTKLFDSKISFKMLKRTLCSEDVFSILLIDIDNFEFYKEIYGELAADKMLQTYTAILSSALESTDYLGHLAKDDFLLITTPYKAEKIANYFVYAFDAIADKFYSDEDANRGYIILQGDEMAGKRVNIVTTSIGIISNEHKKYKSIKQMINSLISTHKLAKLQKGSSYLMERPKLSGENAVESMPYNNKILIVEPDEALSCLLSTAAEMQGYEVRSVLNYDEIFADGFDYEPSVIILDAGFQESLEGLEVCKKIKKIKRLKNAKIILTSIIHDKRLILDTGADLYLPKPYELVQIFSWIERFLKEFNY